MIERQSCTRVATQRLPLGAAALTLILAGAGCPPKQPPAEKPKESSATEKPAAPPTADKGAASDKAPADAKFQAFVKRYADSAGLLVSRWWPADLDGNGRPDRIAVLCDKPFAHTQVTLIVQSDAGLTHRLPWEIDGRSQGLCASVDERFSGCVKAFCQAAEKSAAAPGAKAEADVLAACKSDALPDALRDKILDTCRATPAFALDPKEKPSPTLDNAWKGGREELRIGLRDGKPVVLHNHCASVASTGGGDNYTGDADFEALTLADSTAPVTHLVPVGGSGPGVAFEHAGKNSKLGLRIGATRDPSDKEPFALRLRLELLGDSNLSNGRIELTWGGGKGVDSLPTRSLALSLDKAGKPSAAWLKPTSVALPAVSGSATALELRVVYGSSEQKTKPTQAEGFPMLLATVKGGQRDVAPLRFINLSGGRYPAIANTQPIDPDAQTWPRLQFPKD